MVMEGLINVNQLDHAGSSVTVQTHRACRRKEVQCVWERSWSFVKTWMECSPAGQRDGLSPALYAIARTGWRPRHPISPAGQVGLRLKMCSRPRFVPLVQAIPLAPVYLVTQECGAYTSVVPVINDDLNQKPGKPPSELLNFQWRQETSPQVSARSHRAKIHRRLDSSFSPLD